MKTCHTCKEEKELTEYRGNRRTCKKCENKRQKPKFPYSCVSCSREYLSTKGSEKRRKHKSTCSSCSIKRCWKDKKYRQNHLDSLRKGHNTPEAKKAHSEASKRNFADEAFRQEAMERLNKPEVREKAVAKIREFWKDETRFKLALKKMYKTRCRKVECSRGVVDVKSGYEERTILLLDLLGKKWDYEPRSFYLTELGKVYIPDFFVEEDNLWIEVKGYWYKDAKEKWDAWKKEYPELNVMLIDKKTLQELEKNNGGNFESFINSKK